MEPLTPDWRTIGGGADLPAAPGTHARPHAKATRTITLTPRSMGWLLGGLIAAALTGGTVFLALMPTGGEVVIEAATSDLAAAGPSDSFPPSADLGRVIAPVTRDLVVDVEGAVAHPGLVHVPAGGRVGDALAKAGGFAANADLARTASQLNLAQQVTDGLKVVVPAMGQADPATEDVPGVARMDGPATPGLVDLNVATDTELDSLPGVGPATIARIVSARQTAPFTSAQDLRTRDIVGDAVFEKVKGLVTVGR